MTQPTTTQDLLPSEAVFVAAMQQLGLHISRARGITPKLFIIFTPAINGVCAYA